MKHKDCSYGTVGNIKVILPLGQVPELSHVTKRAGKKVYRVCKQLTVFDDNGKRQVINSNGCRYLVDTDNGTSHAVGDHVEVVWHTNIEDLKAFLDDHDIVQ